MALPKLILPRYPLRPAGFYEISFETDLSHLLQKLQQEEIDHYLQLFDQAQENPKLARRAVENFKEKYPDVPEIANLLSFIYVRLKEIKKAEALIKDTYERHPDYFFGKINYADQALRQKKLELIPAIFNSTYDLQDLFPEKQVFHYSEFRSFMTVMGFYHLAIKDREKAKIYYEKACAADPWHPSVKLLEKKLVLQIGSRLSAFLKMFKLLLKKIRIQKK